MYSCAICVTIRSSSLESIDTAPQIHDTYFLNHDVCVLVYLYFSFFFKLVIYYIGIEIPTVTPDPINAWCSYSTS